VKDHVGVGGIHLSWQKIRRGCSQEVIDCLDWGVDVFLRWEPWVQNVQKGTSPLSSAHPVPLPSTLGDNPSLARCSRVGSYHDGRRKRPKTKLTVISTKPQPNEKTLPKVLMASRELS